MPAISAVFIVQDEAARLGAAIAAVRPWVDEVLVLDGGSRDDTIRVARQQGARVETHPFEGFVDQKRRATNLACHDLVLSLDADECIDRVLGEELRSIGDALEWNSDGAWVRRRNYLDGRALRASGWYPDWRIRLFRRSVCRWVGDDPHDRVELVGRSTRLAGHIHHDVGRTTSQYLDSTRAHATRSARSLIRSGTQPGPLAPWLRALGHLARKILLRAAWRDGRRGWTVAWVGACGVLWKYRAAREQVL